MLATGPLPLLHHTPGARVAWWHGQAIGREVFLGHARQIAKNLPDALFALNLCEDRYLFIAAFAAVLLREQTNLLPSSRTENEITRIENEYRGSYRINDADLIKVLTTRQRSSEGAHIPAAHTAAITFTSGSTGRPRPNPKPWASLVLGARLAQERFAVAPGSAIVATVPPQHMYGLETSVLLPLIAAAEIHGGRPFFAEDIRAALAQVAAPRLLITTPAHLRVCVQARVAWPAIDTVISATAPLSKSLAQDSEAVFKAPLKEIYGCTEGGSLASRHTLRSSLWRTYRGVQVTRRGETFFVSGGHLPQPVALSDNLTIVDEQHFHLLGRHEDLVNVAGKRASLANLNHQLNEIPGVEDGVFIMFNEAETDAIARPTALVVAPTLDERQILAALATRIDAAFLPRPLYKVERLPRNDTGKLPRKELLSLLSDLRQTRRS